MNYVFLLIAAMACNIGASDSKSGSEVVNKKFIELVVSNTILGQENEKGDNFAELEQYIKDHKKEIDFNYIASYKETLGQGGPYTALQLACKIDLCSHHVVQFLIENGACIKKCDGSDGFSSAYYCWVKLDHLYEQYGQKDKDLENPLYNNQFKKFQYLKKSVSLTNEKLNTKEKLKIDAGPVRFQWRFNALREAYIVNGHDAQYKELVEGISFELELGQD